MSGTDTINPNDYLFAIDTESINRKRVGWHWFKEKSGGAQNAGEYGGVYKNPQGKVALIKKEKNISANISEYLGGQIFHAIYANYQYSPRIELMVPVNEPKIPSDGSNIYVRSEYMANFNDMHKDMGYDKRPKMLGTREKLFGVLTKVFDPEGEYLYTGFNKIGPASLLIGDFDIHTGNIGVIRDLDKPEQPPYLARIDFAAAFNKLENDIHPNSDIRHPVAQGPTNHYKEFPAHLKLNDSYVTELLKVANTNLEPVIKQSVENLAKFYNKEAMVKWAKRAMPNFDVKGIASENYKTVISDQLMEVMKRRQESLREYAMQIKLGLIYNQYQEIKQNKGSDINLKAQELMLDLQFQEVVQENRDYFKNLLNNRNKFKFRDDNITGNVIKNRQAKNFICDKILSIQAQLLLKENGLEQNLKRQSYKNLNNEAVNINPEYLTATQNLDNTLKKAQSYKEALVCYNENLQKNPKKSFVQLSEQIEENGNKVIIFHAPGIKEEEKNNPDNQVKYVIDINGKLTIQAGKNVSCILPPQKRLAVIGEKNEGFEIVALNKGKGYYFAEKGRGTSNTLVKVDNYEIKRQALYQNTKELLQVSNSRLKNQSREI